MAKAEEDRGRSVPLAGYEPTRPARLRAADAEPPPLPLATYRGEIGFGGEDEDGLRMIAALETLTSLEPDFSDDLTAEASVTIIETAGGDDRYGAWSQRTADHRPLRHLIDEARSDPGLLLNGYETFLGQGDEATVEIVETTHSFDEPEPLARAKSAHPASLAERLAAATGRSGRFFKALSGS
jgi:hypothetical protein